MTGPGSQRLVEDLRRRLSTLRARAEAAEAERGAMRAVVEAAQVALNDWLLTYASDMCHASDVDAARARIRQAGGTLAYISDTLEQIATLTKGEG